MRYTFLIKQDGGQHLSRSRIYVVLIFISDKHWVYDAFVYKTVNLPDSRQVNRIPVLVKLCID
ncbi:hypothetical protein SAMN04488121_1082 [Chitinophaga filiformis]|uniref:Uncharacterized protein n=1 Tax=Chitinophaga filiformis TaxID=104663 RepID=A0A1G7YTV7_CHIFI|nr:hypothetical protein SAMN04488121_1082 [Chitinophaga filiformis]